MRSNNYFWRQVISFIRYIIFLYYKNRSVDIIWSLLNFFETFWYKLFIKIFDLKLYQLTINWLSFDDILSFFSFQSKKKSKIIIKNSIIKFWEFFDKSKSFDSLDIKWGHLSSYIIREYNWLSFEIHQMIWRQKWSFDLIDDSFLVSGGIWSWWSIRSPLTSVY